MSRRSSFGYSSYGSRSYGSGGNKGKRRRNNKMKRIVIITGCIAAAAAVTAAVCIAVAVNRGNVETAPDKQESRQSVTTSGESSAGEESKEESKAEESSGAADIKGYYDGRVFMYDSYGYEMFYGTDGSAKNYAAVISNIKSAVGKNVNVYNMVVPNHAPFGLPEKYLDDMNDERENIKTIYSSYTEEVFPIDVFDALEKHKGEYIYFRSDANWTALGAYYAYQEFCKKAGAKAVELGTLSKDSITGFKGTLFTATQTDENPDGNKELAAAPDTVVYYNMPGIESCILMENGKSEEQEVPLIASFAEGRFAYSAFLWGDNPYMKVRTTQKTGRKLCIIKDTYGSAFTPFLTANFDEIFIVDPTYYNDNIVEYIQKNKYTDVLVINSIMNANTQFRVDDIMSILK